ncbi:MAG: efflux RND transporter periplasmic adaptor subunit [Prochlorothrix sp.]|nr:efflux RND transporter periplasmic adaptor subunit [Prochlorothrix sp.]
MPFPFVGSLKPVTAIVLLLGGGLSLGLGLWLWRQRTPDFVLEDLTVEVQPVDLTLKVTAGGTVVPVRSVNLSPKQAGLLAALDVEQGDRVQAGQLLALMDSRDVDAQLIQAEANLQQAQARLAELENGSRSEDINRAQAQVVQAQAQVAEAESRLALAQQRLQRNQDLFAAGAIAQDDLDAAQTEQRQTQAQLNQTRANLVASQQQLAQLQNGPRPEAIAQAQAQVLAAQGQIMTLRVQKADTLIRAPFAGIVTQRYADPGAFVTPTTSASSTASATSTSIVAIAQGLEVLANVSEVDVGQLYPEQLVEVVADGFPAEAFAGQVRLIAPEAIQEQNVTSFQVRVSLLNGQDRLKSGMNVDVSFVGEQTRNALAVPTVAIVSQGGESGVLVPNDRQEPVFRAIAVGSTVGDLTQVLEGLAVGDRVFTELPPGLSFEEIEAEESEAEDVQ